MGSSRTRAQTHVPCIGRRTPNHCATREVPSLPFIHTIPFNSNLRLVDGESATGGQPWGSRVAFCSVGSSRAHVASRRLAPQRILGCSEASWSPGRQPSPPIHLLPGLCPTPERRSRADPLNVFILPYYSQDNTWTPFPCLLQDGCWSLHTHPALSCLWPFFKLFP